MTTQTLRDAFVEELSDVLSAEKQLVQALPRMAEAASDARLKEAIALHLDETREQVGRIEQVFESLDLQPRSRRCEGMEGIISEGREHLENGIDPEALDAILIASSQKAEHYEIATYGSLCSWAEELGLDDAARLLRMNLDEEKVADQNLTDVALSRVNSRALPREDGGKGSGGSRQG